MKIRKFLALTLILCLTLTAMPALAVPCRELQAMDVMLDGRLQALLEIAVASAASPDEAPLLNAGEAPDPALAERALLWAALHTEQTSFLSAEAAKRLYSQLFTEGEYVLPKEAATKWASVTPEGIEFDTDTALNAENVGVFIYSAVFDGTDVTMKGDVYACAYEGDFETVDELPEDAAAWLFHVKLSLRYAPEKDFGYTISAIDLSPAYQEGDLSRWREIENTDYEYSVNVPASFFHSIDDPKHIVWTSTLTEATLTIDVTEEENPDYDRTLAEFLRAHPDQTVVQQRDFSSFYLLGEDIFELWIVSSNLNWTYHLTLTFPSERAEEFGLYSEFIRNSMIVWGLSNG